MHERRAETRRVANIADPDAHRPGVARPAMRLFSVRRFRARESDHSQKRRRVDETPVPVS
jgi:hypothetical protein